MPGVSVRCYSYSDVLLNLLFDDAIMFQGGGGAGGMPGMPDLMAGANTAQPGAGADADDEPDSDDEDMPGLE